MKSCYEAFVGILILISMLHTGMVFFWEASLVANIAGWLIVAVLFLIGRIFGMFKSFHGNVVKSCYGGFVGILYFGSILHTCTFFFWEARLGAIITGWLVVAVLILIGRIFGIYKSENEETDSSDEYSGK